MKTPPPNSRARVFLSGLAVLLLSVLPLSAEQFGLFTYELSNGNTVTITDYPEDATGEVVIPAEIRGFPVIAIGWHAFSDCSSLTRITIPETVTTIWPGAFEGCSSLTSISIPDGVTVLHRQLFAGCHALTSISIGSGVSSMHWGTFSEIPVLESIEVDPANSSFSSIDGVLFNASQDRLIRCPRGKKGRIIIPSTVTEIASKEIENELHVAYFIGEGAFLGCAQLTEVIMPEGITRIGRDTFWGCSGLLEVTIPEAVTEIGGRAFQDCSGLTQISLGASISKVGDASQGRPAFSGCSGLRSFEVDPANESFFSEDGVLYYDRWQNRDRVSLVHYPAAKTDPSFVIPAFTTLIAVEAFAGNRHLTSLSFPDSNSQFEVGIRAFARCTGLTSVHLPASFSFRLDLDSLDIDRTYAVRNQSRSNRSIPVADPESSFPFSGCTSLTAIHVDPDHPYLSSLDGVLFSKNQATLIYYPVGRVGDYSIPLSVTRILSRAYLEDRGNGTGPEFFFYCWHGAFDGCIHLTGVTIPEGVTLIGPETFRGCTALTTVTLPASLEAFSWAPDWLELEGDGAFADCSSLQSVIFLGDAPSRVTEESFANTAPGFSVFYLSCSQGFTSPTWEGYPSVRIDESACPAAGWLAGHGLPHDSDLSQDLNGDGVSLLMAYALNLDPNVNLRGRLPKPELGEGTLKLTYYGAKRGITYTVETSTDLENWTTDGVVPVALDDWEAIPDFITGVRSMEVARDAPSRYLRLVVKLN